MNKHAHAILAATVLASGVRQRPKRQHSKKTPHSATDGARLRKAELKRRRKAAQRNTDRAVIIGGADA